MPRVASDQPLPDTATKSKAPAYASTARALMGRISTLAELLQGRVPVTLGRRTTPPNPQRLIGIDHSGPPWGSAWRHPLLVVGGCQTDYSGDVVGQRVVGAFTITRPLIIPLRIYVRPHAQYFGCPYSRGHLAFRAYRASGTGSLDIDIWARHGGSTARANGTTYTTSSGFTTTASEHAPTDIHCDLVPGYNDLDLTFGSSTSVEITIETLCVYLGVKRLHEQP